MNIAVKFDIKSNPTEWSNQKTCFVMSDGTKITLSISGNKCNLILEGNSILAEYFYTIWELLA